jgi:hypothetical protein
MKNISTMAPQNNAPVRINTGDFSSGNRIPPTRVLDVGGERKVICVRGLGRGENRIRRDLWDERHVGGARSVGRCDDVNSDRVDHSSNWERTVNCEKRGGFVNRGAGGRSARGCRVVCVVVGNS